MAHAYSFNWCIIVLHIMIQTNWGIIVPHAWPTSFVVRKIKLHYYGMNVDDKSSRTTLYQRVYIGMTQIYIHYTAFVLFINVDKMHLNKVYISIFIVWPPKLIRYKVFSGTMVTGTINLFSSSFFLCVCVWKEIQMLLKIFLVILELKFR